MANPRALITGASSGIGRSYAEQLAAAGYDLVIVARRAERLNELAAALMDAHGAGVEVLPADLSEAAGVRKVVERIASGAPLALVINNAGFATRGPLATLDPEAFDSMLAVNITAVTHLSIAALKRMTADGAGAVINIASGTVFMQMPGNAGYGASKNYVTALTRHMQVETAGANIRVQLLVPGIVATEFHSRMPTRPQFPPHLVMSADDVVRASLRALDMNEPVCFPSLPDIKDWDAYVAAERQIAAGASRDKPASRYT
ncbi:MAG TPA: SDR family oxidoreductase [Caulobacterales bacterium]|nr:SDR family oxidoreductase [Caulobacterales bacterium]